MPGEKLRQQLYELQVAESQRHDLDHNTETVSYTHLDVYKRQI